MGLNATARLIPLAWDGTPQEQHALTLYLSNDPGVLPFQMDSTAPDRMVAGQLWYNAKVLLQLEGLPDEAGTPEICAVFINGCRHPGAAVRPLREGEKAVRGSEKSIFQDCLDYATVSLEVTMGDRAVMLYAREVILVRMPEALRDSVQDMLTYVARRPQWAELLFNGPTRSRLQAKMIQDRPLNRAALLSMILDTLRTYRSCLSYFSAGSRFDMEKHLVTDRLERLQRISAATVRSILRHPEELTPARPGAGLEVNGRRYLPLRAVGERNLPTRDTPENRVVLGFLYTLKKLLQDMDSTWVRQTLQVRLSLCTPEDEARLAQCQRETEQLLRLYQKVLPIPAPLLTAPPRSTATFRTVLQYRQIYTRIRELFDLGLYDLLSEDQSHLLPISQLSTLYEAYVLVCLLEEISEHLGGLQPTPKHYLYPYPQRADGRGHGEQPTHFPAVFPANTFVFQRGGAELITLYYQPVIYVRQLAGKNHEEKYVGSNGIDLCRRKGSGDYYTPDFLIKLHGDVDRYIFCDAKFKPRSNVRTGDMPELIRKYVQEIHPQDAERSRVIGLFAIYGNSLNDLGDDVFVASLPLMTGMEKNYLGQITQLF